MEPDYPTLIDNLQTQVNNHTIQINTLKSQASDQNRRSEFHIKQLAQESKGLQIENDMLQKTVSQLRHQLKSFNDQSKNKIHFTQQQQKLDQQMKDHQEQFNKWQQTQKVLMERIEQQQAENIQLVEQLDYNTNLYQQLECQFIDLQKQQYDEVILLQNQLVQKQGYIEELKYQSQPSQQYNKDQQQIRTLGEELNKAKKVISNQQLQIQQQCKLFNELKNDLHKKLQNERSKSQLSVRMAQDLKNEYEKKYSHLMEQIVKNDCKLTNRSINQSYRILPNSLDCTMSNDISRISNHNNARLSALNKALSDSIDEIDKSLISNISQIHTKRKPSHSEWEKKDEQIIVSPRRSTRNSQQYLSPKQIYSTNNSRRQSSCTQKCIKQYTFNLCEINDNLPDSNSVVQTKLLSKRTPDKLSIDSKKSSQVKLSLKSRVSKENVQMTEENLKINDIISSKQFQLMEDKDDERLDTNMRFNSLLKVI